MLEAVAISAIGTMIVVILEITRTKYREKVKLFGPWAYKLDEFGAPKEISTDSIPAGVLEATLERAREEAKLPKPVMLTKTNIVFFAVVIFIIQLVIFSIL